MSPFLLLPTPSMEMYGFIILVIDTPYLAFVVRVVNCVVSFNPLFFGYFSYPNMQDRWTIMYI